MIHGIIATVLFVQDLASSQAFYRDTLKLEMTESDAHGATFHVGDRYLILLDASAAADLLGMEVDALNLHGASRVLLAAGVENVDAVYEELKTQGVTLLRQPTDQPWGLRTAHFADPEGNLWEINQPVAAQAAS